MVKWFKYLIEYAKISKLHFSKVWPPYEMYRKFWLQYERVQEFIFLQGTVYCEKT